MILKKKSTVLKIALFLILGVAVTLTTDCFPKTVTSPSNINYDVQSACVEFINPKLISITQSKDRGFPFTSQTKLNYEYPLEYRSAGKVTVITCGDPPVVTDSLAHVLRTWQFYADVLIWTIFWILLKRSIKSYVKKV